MRNNPQIGLSMMVGRIVEVESTGDGLSWQNAFETNGPDAVGVSFFGSFLCLNLGSVVFSAIGWYLGLVLPGEYGIKRPWYVFYNLHAR